MSNEVADDMKDWPRDLIAYHWAETLSEGEQSVLLTSSLRRLQQAINLSESKPTVNQVQSAGERERGIDTPFSLSQTLALMVEWLKHLHDDHECDCVGWEQRSFLIEAAGRYQSEIASQRATPAPVAVEQRCVETIQGYAEQLSLSLQVVTGMSDGARLDIKQLLIEFADEIKRQAVEP